MSAGTTSIITDAPEGYDYPTTRTLKVLGTARCGVNRGNPVRLVEAPDRVVSYQQGRYASGLCLCVSPEKWLSEGMAQTFLQEEEEQNGDEE